MKNITYVNAGAGSGKTYNLISRFTDLIASGKAKPNEVIMTTFSERAAAEIKERAKEALIAKGLTKASLGVEHAAIGTVHGIAYRFIRKYWFRLGLSPDIKVMDDDAQKVYVSQSLSSIISVDELRSLHDFAREFNIVKKGDSGRVYYNFWREQLLAIIDSSLSYEIDDFSASVAHSLEFAGSLFDSSACCGLSDDEIERALGSLQSFWESMGESKKGDKALDEIKQLRAGVKNRNVAWYGMFGGLESSLRKNKAEEWVTDMINAAASVRRSEYAHAKVADYIKLIFRLAERWRKLYSQFKKQKNVLDYEDLEKYMLALLSDPVVAADVADSFKFLFVDEYQDCSPIQVKIFDRLSDLMTGSCWVGDVKQAIYAFRGSATELTRAVMQKVAKGGDGFFVETLGQSWRSLPPIVDVCNKLFSKVYGTVIPAKDIVLEPQRKEDPSSEPCLRYWNLSGLKNKDDKAGRIALHVADLVLNGARPDQIAILARSNGDLARLAAALHSAGLPSSLPEQSIAELEATDLLLAVLVVIVSPRDILAKATIVYLTEPGRTLESIMNGKIEWDANDDGQWPLGYLDDVGLVSQLTEQGARERYLGLSVSTLVEAVTIELGLFDEVKKMNRPDVQTACLHSLILTARSFEDACLRNGSPATIPAFIDYVRDSDIMCGGERRGVQLVTYHSSKGLQWPYVVLTSLDDDVMSDADLIRNEVFGVHKDYVSQPSADNLYPEVFLRVCPWIFGAKKNVDDEFMAAAIVSSDVFGKVRESQKKQVSNLLYVGMTRPSDVLIMTVGNAGKPLMWINGVAPGSAALRPDGDILGVGVPFADCTLPEGAASAGLPDILVEKPSRIASFAPDDYAETAPLRDVSPSGVDGLGDVVKSEVISGRIPLSAADGDDAVMNDVGNCIHHIFSLADDVTAAEFDSLAAQIVGNYGLGGVIASPSLVCEAWRNLVSKLTELYGPARTVFHERPFSASLDGFCVTGALDLLWVTDSGNVLVDFKSCPLAPDVVLNPDDAHFVGLYAGQLDCYEEALAAAGEHVVAKMIYYPVSGLLVELGDSNAPLLPGGLSGECREIKQAIDDLEPVFFDIVCEDFNLRRVLDLAAKEERSEIDFISADIDAYDVDNGFEYDSDDEEDDDDGGEDDDYGSSPMGGEREFNGDFKILAYVRGQSGQGAYMQRKGGTVSLVVMPFSSPGDCSLVFNILVAIKRNFFPADIYYHGEKITIDSDDLVTWLLEKSVNNFGRLLDQEGKVDYLYVQGLRRRYYFSSDYLMSVDSRFPMPSFVAATDYANMQWKCASYKYADKMEVASTHGELQSFCVLRNDGNGTVIDQCDAVALMLHNTPIYARSGDFYALASSNSHFHRLDLLQYAVDHMPPDEWESLCLSVACCGNPHPATCLLLWNSAAGDMADNPVRRYLSTSRFLFFFRWQVGGAADAKLGDVVYFVDVSDGGGILLKGEIINEPYVDRKTAKGKYSRFVDVWIRTVGHDGEPLLPLDRLRQVLPDVPFGGCSSFVKLDSASAARLGASLVNERP